MLYTLLLFMISISVVNLHEYASWDYKDSGKTWKSVQNWSCGGERQSPIDIVTSSLVENSNLTDLKLTSFDQTFDGDWTNTGHTIKFSPGSSSATLGAVLDNHRGSYVFQQFHFHWGSVQNGSEHCLDGQSFMGELHFVTRKTTGIPTDDDAFSVLGVWLVSDPDLLLDGTVWMELLNKLPQENSDTNTAIGIKLSDFIPEDLSYYYYEGSLTTPPCNEVVQWFMLRTPIRVPSDFLAALRGNVTGTDGEPLRMNYRDLQPLNNRRVMIQDNSGLRLVLSMFSTILFAVLILVVCSRVC